MTSVLTEAPTRNPSSTCISSSVIPDTATVTTKNVTTPRNHASAAGRVTLERQECLGDRQGDDEHAAAGGEQAEVEAVDRERREQDLPDRHADRERGERPDHRDPDDDDEQLFEPGPEVVVAARAGEARELREQRALHRLEQQGGIRATKNAEVNAATAAVSPGPFSTLTPSSDE